MSVDQRAYRRVMARLATGVSVLATQSPTPGQHEVMTVNSVMSVSLDPTLLAVAVSADSRWRHALRASCRFRVNVLSANQEHLSRWCARPERHLAPHALAQHPSHTERGLLVFDDALASFDCDVYSESPAGDHDLILGEVLSMRLGPLATPLVFYDSGYTSVTPPLSNEYPALWHTPRLAGHMA